MNYLLSTRITPAQHKSHIKKAVGEGATWIERDVPDSTGSPTR
jgi:hypothetical protein